MSSREPAYFFVRRVGDKRFRQILEAAHAFALLGHPFRPVVLRTFHVLLLALVRAESLFERVEGLLPLVGLDADEVRLFARFGVCVVLGYGHILSELWKQRCEKRLTTGARCESGTDSREKPQ